MSRRTWKRGTALDDAPIIHEVTRDDVQASAYCTPGEGGGRRLLWTSHTIRSSTLAVEIGGQRLTFDLPREAVKSANDRFVVWEPLEDGDYPAGTVILRRYDGTPFERVLFEPRPRSTTVELLLSRDWLVLTGHDDLRPWLKVLDLREPEGEFHELPLPDEASTIWVFWYASEPDGDHRRDMRLDIGRSSPWSMV